MEALTLSGMLARREISAAQVMQSTLERIAMCNGAVNAIVSLRDADVLMDEARAADVSERQGWLHGVPIAVKDLANVRGIVTSRGSRVFADQVADADDMLVARMRAAGAIVIGKTNTPEFGLGSHTTNPVFGATRNPYDLSRSAGGSSGGAAAALASGMLCVADGSDMMGSLRNPAGWNNVYGMRPTWSLVPSEPVGDTFLQHLSTSGPMARCPRDLAALLDTMAGRDPRQPHGLTQAPSLPQMDVRARGLRIGWMGDWGGAYPMEPGVLDVCAAALQQMEAQGQHVEPVSAPFDRDALWQSWTVLRSFIFGGKYGALYGDEAMRAKIKDSARWEIARGLDMTALQMHEASVIRSDWFKTASVLFDTFDVLALPSAQMWPFDVALDWPRAVNGVAMDTYHRWMEVVVPASLIGLPAISVPVGFGGPHDLPMGLQLIGRPGSDAKLLQLAERWHQATNWPKTRPPQVPT